MIADLICGNGLQVDYMVVDVKYWFTDSLAVLNVPGPQNIDVNQPIARSMKLVICFKIQNFVPFKETIYYRIFYWFFNILTLTFIDIIKIEPVMSVASFHKYLDL